jgi:hypothetical protein
MTAATVAAVPFAMLDMQHGFDATNERVCVGRERTRSRVSKLMERRIASSLPIRYFVKIVR